MYLVRENQDFTHLSWMSPVSVSLSLLLGAGMGVTGIKKNHLQADVKECHLEWLQG